MQRRSPRIPNELDALTDPKIELDVALVELALDGRVDTSECDELEMHECRLTNLSLTGASLRIFRVRDCEVRSSEWSGLVAENAGLARVEFIDCRMTGIDLTASRLTDVRFHRCRLDQATFRMVEAERVEFDECDLRGADFHAAKLDGAAIERCILGGVDFSQASMAGARLHGSDVEGVRGGRSLEGVHIDAAQIVPMALNVFDALGIEVDDVGYSASP